MNFCACLCESQLAVIATNESA